MDLAVKTPEDLQMAVDSRRTWVGLDREKFEKQQTECISKALKNEECAAKEKHVRRTIIGTWQEKGCYTFWLVIGRMPLPSQAVMCWKSLLVFHKLLREGHPTVLKDSFVYRKTLSDLISVYRFATGKYGKFIAIYCQALEHKLRFHYKYPKFPGSLLFNDEKPLKIPTRDINDLFHFAVEVFDYQDALIAVQEPILASLEKGVNNSQLPTSQCKIAPLVPIIKECGAIYDMLVNVLIKMHRSLPPETLEGHRDRFLKQFISLRQFFHDAGLLTYITSFTVIPDLPDQPPDFLIHAYEPPKPSPKLQRKESVNKPISVQKDERDMLIEQLMREIFEIREELSRYEKNEPILQQHITKLQQELDDYRRIAEQTCDENVFLKSQLEEKREEEDAKEKAKSADEKFTKLKQVYGKLRNEHVTLLRSHADFKGKAERYEKEKEEFTTKMETAEDELKKQEEECSSLKECIRRMDIVNKDVREQLEKTEENMNEMEGDMDSRVTSLTESLNQSEAKCKELESHVEHLNQSMESQISTLQSQIENVTTSKIMQEEARKSAETSISKLREERELIEAELTSRLKESRITAERETTEKENALSKISTLESEMELKVQQLTSALKQLTTEKESENAAKQAAESTMAILQKSSGNEIENLSKEVHRLSENHATLEIANAALTKEAEERTKSYSEESQTLSLQLSEMKINYEKERQLKAEEEKARKTESEKLNSIIEELRNEAEQLKKTNTTEHEARKRTEETMHCQRLENERKIKEASETSEEQRRNAKNALILTTVEECEAIIKDTLLQFDNPTHTTGTTCTAEYLKSRLLLIGDHIDLTSTNFVQFSKDHEDAGAVVRTLTSASHMISDGLLHGKSTSHMASAEDASQMVNRCRKAGDSTLKYLETLKQKEPEDSSVEASSKSLKQSINEILQFAEELIPKESDTLDGVENIVDEEINATAQLVADAASRIEEMLQKSRKEFTGVQLEVNERILDSCTGLMQAIRQLIYRSRDLQGEIVSEGKGTASEKEFYKRHHKWTEGLISAAKSVGWGASVLVDAADKVVQRKGKFEELVVASNEIAASTAQLVAASKVKASRNSKQLSPLTRASKTVGEATAGVVAAVRTGAEMSQEAKNVPDYSKLTLTQTKRLEMDCQVHMLELENDLEKERTKLGKLRKAHYQLAVELYGEEEESKN